MRGGDYINLSRRVYKTKRGQISIEYLILMGFIGIAVAGMLISGVLYTLESQDKIKTNQVSQAANKIIQTAEAVYYSGAPSRMTITVYIPKDVKSIALYGTEMVINVTTSSGVNTQGYTSKVPLETEDGTNILSSSEGIKKLLIKAEDDSAEISQV